MRAIYLPAYSFPSYGVVSEIAPGMAGSRMGPSEGVKHVINCIKRPQADSRYQTRTASRVGHTPIWFWTLATVAVKQLMRYCLAFPFLWRRHLDTECEALQAEQISIKTTIMQGDGMPENLVIAVRFIQIDWVVDCCAIHTNDWVVFPGSSP